MEISTATVPGLQMIQDAFADRLKIAMVLTDTDGICITDPSLPVQNNAKFEREILSRFIAKISRFDKQEITYVADTPFTPVRGLKCILSTMVLNNTIYVLWAGPLLTKGVRETALQQLPPEQKQFEQNISILKETPSDEMTRVIQKIEKIKHIFRRTIDYDGRHNKAIQQFHLIENLLFTMDENNFFHEAAKILLEKNGEISFIGCAEKTDPFQYRINQVLGNYNEGLINQPFLIGEGLLGQAAASGQFLVWNNLESDERASQFSKNSLLLQSLFCFQIKKENQINTLVFGGSYQKGIDDEQAALLRILFSLFQQHESQLKVKQGLMVAQTRLNILKDLSIILSDLKDINRILYLLMDISINLVKGSFTCIFLNQNEYMEQSKMVSRGLSSEKISSYGNYLRKKYFGNTAFVPKEPVYMETPWNDSAFECPLKQDEEIVGVFCVEISEEQVYEEYSPLLTSFARLCSFALQLLIHDEMKMIDDEKIKLLFHVTEQFNLPAYQLILKTKPILEKFISHLQLNNKTLDVCVQALNLSAYQPEFLERQGILKKIIQIVDEFRLLQSNGQRESISRESQILYIVNDYLQNNENTVYPDLLDTCLIEKFEEFLLRTNAKESIFSDIELAQPRFMPNVRKIKSQFHLSEREEEVLDLIMKGINNKEIADKLYISEHTVKNHLTNIFRKLNVKDRAQAIAKCYSIGYQYVEE